MNRRLTAIAMAGAMLTALLPGSAAAADPVKRPSGAVPAWVDDSKLPNPATMDADQIARLADRPLDPSLTGTGKRQDVIVRLSAKPVVEFIGKGLAAQGRARTTVTSQQDQVLAAARGADANLTLLGRTRLASNLVMLRLNDAGMKALARNRNVLSIKPVKNYTRDLSDTVPYIGAKSVQSGGAKGAGVDVAILDSGIDYTHKALGGAGTQAAYEAAYGTGTGDLANTVAPSWPAGRVSGGYDFVGESWPNGDLAPDPDPIDSPSASAPLGVAYGTDGGHGTHVADIIGGTKGVAPKANLFGIKVCSSVSTACSGVALIQGIDWAMDPDGDGDLDDHVDIINMSLGSDYGTVYDDDLTQAVDRATFYAGILTVASAGNGENVPYISGTPAAAPSALSVAQTQVPSAVRYFLRVTAPAAIAGVYRNTETVEWAPIEDGFTGQVVYVGRGCPASEVGTDDPYLDNPSGKIALIDRGACSISSKVDRAARAGATAVLIGLIADGDAVSFSQGSGDTFVETMVIQKSLSDAMKANLPGVTVSVSTADSAKLVGGMAGTSSRGPSSDNKIKPEIGAPGASVSAVSGSFTATEAFGGTSGAAPMVTGAAALLKSKFPTRNALEIKALLMNNAEMTVYTDPSALTRQLAPITRIGAGEVRVNRSAAAAFMVFDKGAKSAALSYGFVDAWKDSTTTRTLTVKNYSNKAIVLRVTNRFRYANDELNGAVKISAPKYVTVRPRDTTTIKVKVAIDASKLREWTMNGGADGINPAPLDLMEYDGFLKFDRLNFSGDNADPVHVPWQVLPRLSGNVAVTTPPVPNSTAGVLTNTGAGTAALELYSLVGTSPNLPLAPRGSNAPIIDLKAVGVQTFQTQAGYCGPAAGFLYQIAINTWERQTHAVVPGELNAYLDTTGDGTADYIVWASAVSSADASAVTWVYTVATGKSTAWFYADHGTNDSNTILTFCSDQIGMTAANFGDPIGMDVVAFDSYYRAWVETDAIEGMAVTPMGERFWGPVADIPAAATGSLALTDYGTVGTNPSETGVLLVTNSWDESGSWLGGAPADKEAIQIAFPTP